MTIYLRDASHYDGTVSYSGLAGLTSKATEGTTTRDDTYGPHLNAARAAGVPVLGSYHVLRTPGANEGTLAQQLAYWVTWMDSQTPWWRTWPHWILQIDAEHWEYDTVSSSTVKQFAAMVKAAGLPGWVVTYASHGQYGDTLAGLSTPLWNANYGQNTGAYPGDSAAGWAAYSGQTPVLLQYASKGYDHNAFRGTLTQLLALIGGDEMELTNTVPGTATPDHKPDRTVSEILHDAAQLRAVLFGQVPVSAYPADSPLAKLLATAAAPVDLKALAAAVVALLPPAAAVDPVAFAAALTTEQLQAIGAAMGAEIARQPGPAS